jgi:rhamnosyltransferase subunit B
MTVACILLNTFGSFGDLHPFLALAIELRERGHEAVIATSEIYRSKVKAENIGFAAVRPDVGELRNNVDLIRKVWDPRRGTEYLLKDVILPSLEDTFEDLLAISEKADLLITHTAGYAGPIVAEVLGKRWLSVALQPMVFFSSYDPPVLAPVQWLRHFYRFGRWPFRLIFQMARRQVKPWMKPILRLRRNVGLTTTANPIFKGQFSRYGTLALFSKYFAQPQPDWPRHVTVTGFTFYDRPGDGFGRDTTVELADFLAGGSPPVVFTLGSSAVLEPGNFFLESLAAVQKLGLRAVLLAGEQGRNHFPDKLPDSIFLADYAPYSELMPKALVNVHQGGIGTTAQALQAGRPMLVVPWAHDQPDNAERLRKLGVARTLGRGRYTADAAAREVQELLAQTRYAETTQELRNRLLTEQGASAACDQIEAIL